MVFSINQLAKLSGQTWRTVRTRLQGIEPVATVGGDPVYGADGLQAVFDCYSAELSAQARKVEAEASQSELDAIAAAQAVLPRQYIAAALGVVLVVLRQEDLGERADAICERILDRLIEVEEGAPVLEPSYSPGGTGPRQP